MAKIDNTKLLLELLTDKKLVSFEGSTTFPSEEKLYTISGMKRFFRSNKLTNDKVDESLYIIQNDKDIKLESVKVFNHSYNETFPYFYIGLDKEEVTKLAEELEKKSLLLKNSDIKKPTEIKEVKKRKSK